MVTIESSGEEKDQPKINRGKRKIDIVEITSKSQKQVTFSKRRLGLFKKASELCCLCGAQIGIITFSGAGKVYSYGHPSVDDIVLRYLNKLPLDDHKNNDQMNAYHYAKVEYHQQQYQGALAQIEAEKNASKGTIKREHDGNNWWDKPVDNMGLLELEHMKVALEEFRGKVASRLDDIYRPTMNMFNTYHQQGLVLAPLSHDQNVSQGFKLA